MRAISFTGSPTSSRSLNLRARIAKRLATRYCDRMTADLDEALAWVGEAQRSRTALSVGLVGNIADVLPERIGRGTVRHVRAQE